MLDKVSKFLSISLFSLYTVAAFGYSTPIEQLEGVDASVTGITQNNVMGSAGGKNPAHPAQKDRYGIFFFGDYLYWQASQDGLQYTTTSDSFTTGPLVITNGKAERIRPGYESGFRVGAGYRFKRDAWDFLVSWTDLTSSRRNSTVAPSSGFDLAVWSPASIGSYASKAAGHWNLGYYIFDAELGRNYFVSKALALRPFLGLRGAWINQKFDANYQNVGVAAIGTTTVETSMKNDYSAGGVRVGFNMEWLFWSTFGIYGNISGSLVYGTFAVKTAVEADEEQVVHLKSNITRMRPNLETGLGLRWATNWGSCRFSLSLGYEMIQWWNTNQFVKVEFPGAANGFVNRSNGDLGLQGMTLAAGLEF
jgi:hypothetical protein